jgi:glucokinase
VDEFVLAVDFGGTKIGVATAALDGVIHRSDRIDTLAERGAHQAVERGIAAARELLEQSPGRCVAAGVVSPGIVLDDRVLLAPNVPGWGDLALPALLTEGLDVPHVVVGNDVKAAARAEARSGALRGADPGILLSLGTGIAAAVVIGGKVLNGAHGAAGEIGYSLRGPRDQQGAADGRAPLEEIAGGRAIGERASALLGEPVAAAEAFAHPDARVRAVVAEGLDALAVQATNLAIAVDPVRIAVGGGLMASSEAILAALGPRLAKAVPFPPELVRAQFVHDGPLRGAVALAADAVATRSTYSPSQEEAR